VTLFQIEQCPRTDRDHQLAIERDRHDILLLYTKSSDDPAKTIFATVVLAYSKPDLTRNPRHREPSMAAKKVKNQVSELQDQIRKLADRFDDERQKQVAALEKQLEAARERVRDELNKQKENLAKLEELQSEYREKAGDAVSKQVDKLKKAADEAMQRAKESEARKALLETEVKVLKATAKQAHSLAGWISKYEKDLEKRAKQIERKVTPAAKPAARKAAAKKAPAKKAAAPKVKAAPKAKAAAKKAPAKKAPAKKKAAAK
jgi:colicin import membrane protein